MLLKQVIFKNSILLKRISYRKLRTLDYVILFVWIVLSFASFSARAGESKVYSIPPQNNLIGLQPLPGIDDLSGQLSLLSSIVKEIPELFQQAIEYEVNLQKILVEQIRLNQILLLNPNFEFLWRNRNFIDFEFSVVSEAQTQLVNSLVLSTKAVELWKQDLAKTFQELKIESVDQLAALLRKEYSQMGKLSVLGFGTELILNLPTDQQIRARKLLKDNQLNELVSLFEAYLPKNLNWVRIEVAQVKPERTYSIDNFKKLLEREQRLGNLFDIFSILAKSGEIKDFMSILRELKTSDLETHADYNFQKQFIRRITEIQNQGMPSFHGYYLKKYLRLSEIRQTKIEKGNSIILREQHPNLAIFRGFAGSDCSSQVSFAYPNDPNARVFLVYNKMNNLKGYLSTTIVEGSAGEKYLYLVTVSGSRISPADVEILLQGLEKEKASLGVVGILIPTTDKLVRLVNYSAIRGVLEASSQLGSPISFKYQNTDIRTAIERFESEYNTGSYDKMERNFEGILYRPNPKKSLGLNSDAKTFTFLQKQILFAEKIDLVGAIELGIVLAKTSTIEDLQKFIRAVFPKTLQNDVTRFLILHRRAAQSLSLNTNLKESAETIERLFEKIASSISLSQSDKLKKKWLWLRDIILTASDAIVKSDQLGLVERIEEEIKTKKIRISSIILKKWTSKLIESSRYPFFQKRLLLDIEKDTQVNRENEQLGMKFLYALAADPQELTDTQFEKIQEALRVSLIRFVDVKSPLIRNRLINDVQNQVDPVKRAAMVFSLFRLTGTEQQVPKDVFEFIFSELHSDQEARVIWAIHACTNTNIVGAQITDRMINVLQTGGESAQFAVLAWFKQSKLVNTVRGKTALINFLQSSSKTYAAVIVDTLSESKILSQTDFELIFKRSQNLDYIYVAKIFITFFQKQNLANSADYKTFLVRIYDQFIGIDYASVMGLGLTESKINQVRDELKAIKSFACISLFSI